MRTEQNSRYLLAFISLALTLIAAPLLFDSARELYGDVSSSNMLKYIAFFFLLLITSLLFMCFVYAFATGIKLACMELEEKHAGGRSSGEPKANEPPQSG